MRSRYVSIAAVALTAFAVSASGTAGATVAGDVIASGKITLRAIPFVAGVEVEKYAADGCSGEVREGLDAAILDLRAYAGQKVAVHATGAEVYPEDATSAARQQSNVFVHKADTCVPTTARLGAARTGSPYVFTVSGRYIALYQASNTPHVGEHYEVVLVEE